MSNVSREIRPGVTLSLDHPEATAADLVVAEVIVEMATARGGKIQIGDAEMDEIILRCRAKGFDAITGQWLH